MSIAVSVLVRPSPLLRLLGALMAAMSAVSACCLFLFTFPLLPAVVSLSLSLPVGLASLGLLHSAFRARKSFLLDISGLGRIRLREHYRGMTVAWQKETPFSLSAGNTVRLLKGSTLWPCLLSLLLEHEDGRQTSLVVLPDSVAPDAFRALSLALRSIAARSSEGVPKQL